MGLYVGVQSFFYGREVDSLDLFRFDIYPCWLRGLKFSKSSMWVLYNPCLKIPVSQGKHLNPFFSHTEPHTCVLEGVPIVEAPECIEV